MKNQELKCSKPTGLFKDFAKDYDHKEIEFVKVDSTYAEIYYNEDRVGHLENHATHYVVEVYFKRIAVGKKHKKHIKRFIRDYSAWYQYLMYSNQAAENRGFKIQG